jgi:hypothetical protein
VEEHRSARRAERQVCAHEMSITGPRLRANEFAFLSNPNLRQGFQSQILFNK